jgi:ABC-type Na+ efflux pump permease subunit
MTQDGVFCSQNCLEEFRNFRNAMTLATGPGRRRVTLMGLIRYVVILCVLGAVIFAALAALTGTTDIGQMGTQIMRTLRFFLPI